MAYLKLNDSRLIYSTTPVESKLIVSDIVNSDIGPKSGYRLIQSTTDLDLWFGKNFSQRDYYLELLSNGVGLLLGRPMSFPKDTSRDSWERVQGFPEIPDSGVIYKVAISGEEYLWRETEFLRIDTFLEIHLQTLPENPATGIKYNIYGTVWIWIDSEFLCLSKFNKLEVSSLPDYPRPDVVYVSPEDEEYIWNGESDFIRICDLPENLPDPELSESYLNRDTLRIYTDGLWCHPRLSEMPNYEFPSSITNITKDNLSKIESGDSSLAYLLDFSKVESFYSDEALPGFFAIPKDSEGGFQFVWYQRQGVDQQIPFGSDILGPNLSEAIAIRVSGSSSVSGVITETVTKLRQKFWVYQISDKSYIVYSDKISNNRNFYHLSGLKLEPSGRATNDLLQKELEKTRTVSFDFISETVGTTDENIKIEIDIKSKRISVSRFGHLEIYEKPELINTESKLVRTGKRGAGFNFAEGLAEVWSGELSGGTPDEFTAEGYRDCLSAMMESSFSEDFFLIPDIYKYHVPGSIKDTENYFSEYKLFLDYAKTKNCQVLIDNIENPFWKKSIIVQSLPVTGEADVLYKINIDEVNFNYYMWENSEWKNVNQEREKIQEDNFIWNYTEDRENRLIYFYHSINLNLNTTRPGYYLFMVGLLTNNFQLSNNLILYTPPTEDRQSLIEEYKSNYLVDNGQYYYYKNYLNGPDPVSTWVVRFAMSRLSRQFVNKKWDFLAHQMLGEINRAIKDIPEVFSKQFSGIIQSAEVTDITWEYNKININIRVFIYELVDKDINLSLTLNYIS